MPATTHTGPLSGVESIASSRTTGGPPNLLRPPRHARPRPTVRLVMTVALLSVGVTPALASDLERDPQKAIAPRSLSDERTTPRGGTPAVWNLPGQEGRDAKLAHAAAGHRPPAARASRARARKPVSSVPVRSSACPVGPTHSFTDTYGQARGGGRAHRGVDVLAPYGSAVYAVESGVVQKARYNSLGGFAITLRGVSGREFYYAHQSANLVVSGQRVLAGQRIGRVGTSGNAAGTSPHVHFELHPGGSRAVNPTTFVARLC